jgi:hypothetical protein
LVDPDVAIIAGIQQLGADLQVVAALHDSTLEDSANPELTPTVSASVSLPLHMKAESRDITFK